MASWPKGSALSSSSWSLGLGETWPRPLGSDRHGATGRPKLGAAASVDEDLLLTQPVLYQQQPIGAQVRASLLQRSNASSGARPVATVGSLARCGSAPCITSVEVAPERPVGSSLLASRETEVLSRAPGGADWHSDPGGAIGRASSSVVQQENMRLREEIQAMCATIKNQSSQLSQLWADTSSYQARGSVTKSQLTRSASLTAPSGSSEAASTSSMVLSVAELSRQRLEGLRGGRLPLFSPSLDYRLPQTRSYPSRPTSKHDVVAVARAADADVDSELGRLRAENARLSAELGRARSPEPSDELPRPSRAMKRMPLYESPSENGRLHRTSPAAMLPSPALSAAPALDDLSETVVSIGSVGAALEATSGNSAQDDLYFSSPLRVGIRPPRNSVPLGSAMRKNWCSPDESSSPTQDIGAGFAVGSRVRATKDVVVGGELAVKYGTGGRVTSEDERCRETGRVRVEWDRREDGKDKFMRVKVTEIMRVDGHDSYPSNSSPHIHHRHDHLVHVHKDFSPNGGNPLEIKNFGKLNHVQADEMANGFNAIADLPTISVAEDNIAPFSFPQELLSFAPDESVLFSRYHGGDTQRNVHCNIEQFSEELGQLEQLQDESRKLGRFYYKSITVMATRYISLARGNIDKAMSLMDNSQAWRQEFFGKGPLFDYDLINDFSHGMIYFTGRDYCLRPILVIRAERVPKEWEKDGSGVTRLIRILVFCMEYLRRYMLRPGVVENIVVLVDLKNVSAVEVPVTALKRIYSVLSHNYIVLVYRFFIVNMSWVLNAIAAVLKPILTERQKQKLVFLDTISEVTKFTAAHHIEEDLGGTRPQISTFFPFPLLPGPFDAACRAGQRVDAVPNVHKAFTADGFQGKLWDRSKGFEENTEIEQTQDAERIFKACNLPFRAAPSRVNSSRLNEATMVSSVRSSPRSLISSKERLPRLRILIESATGLYDRDFFGNVDVFCVCEIPGRIHSKHRTAVINKHPLVWNDEFEIENYSDGDPLQFTVLDKHMRPTPDDVLGEATLRSTQFYPDGWYGDLDLGAGSGSSRRSLKVRVEVLGLHGYEVLSPSSQNRSPLGKRAKIKVMMLGARGLRSTDLAGKSDPYCVCEVPGKPRTRFETKPVRQNPNPDWNQEWEPPNFETGDPLLFTIYDKARYPLRDEMLGKALMSSSQFIPDGWFGEVMLEEAASTSKATLLLKIDVPNLPRMGSSNSSHTAPAKHSDHSSMPPHGSRCLLSKPISPRPNVGNHHSHHPHNGQVHHHARLMSSLQPSVYTERSTMSPDGTLVLGQPLDYNHDHNQHNHHHSPRAAGSSAGANRSPSDRTHAHRGNNVEQHQNAKARQDHRSTEAIRRGIPVVVQPHMPPANAKRQAPSTLAIGSKISLSKTGNDSDDDIIFVEYKDTPRQSKLGDINGTRHSITSNSSANKPTLLDVDGLSNASEPDETTVQLASSKTAPVRLQRASVTSTTSRRMSRRLSKPSSPSSPKATTKASASPESANTQSSVDASPQEPARSGPPALRLPAPQLYEQASHTNLDAILGEEHAQVAADVHARVNPSAMRSPSPRTETKDDGKDSDDEDEDTDESDDDDDTPAVVTEVETKPPPPPPKDENTEPKKEVAAVSSMKKASISSDSGSSSGSDSPVNVRRSRRSSVLKRSSLRTASDAGTLDTDMEEYWEEGAEENAEEEEAERDSVVEPSSEEDDAVNRAVKQGESPATLSGNPKVKPHKHGKRSLTGME